MHEETEKIRLVESIQVSSNAATGDPAAHDPAAHDPAAHDPAAHDPASRDDDTSCAHSAGMSPRSNTVEPAALKASTFSERARKRRAKKKGKDRPSGIIPVAVVLLIVTGAVWTYCANNNAVSLRATPPLQTGTQSAQVTQQQQQETLWPQFDLGILNPLGWIHSSTPSKTWDQVAELSKPLEALTKLAIFAGLGLWLYSAATRRRYIQFDNLGILLTETSKGQGGARFIPWACIDEVEVRYLKGFDIQSLENAQQKSDSVSNPLIVFHVDDNTNVSIRWHDIIACVEPGSFINALKTYAPAASEKYQFPGDVNKVDSSSYTQLWFKYYSTASDRKRTTQLVEGEQLQGGRYTVAGQIGGGGQGTAYLAVDRDAAPGAKTEIVLKEYILPVHRGERILKQTVEKLEQEAAILRIIDQPNIVKMLDCFVEDHRGYLVMEYVQGRSLKELIQREGPQPEHVVCDIARQVCDVLSYLHGLTPAVVHRDLTPDNLILQEDGLVKLVDFNVAHQLESAATATVVGKHCYIPPEQFRGRPTIQSDIYAFGGTLQYLLTGQDPEPLSVSRPQDRNESVSDELNAIVAKATMPDATKRFATVQLMRSELDQLDGAKTMNETAARSRI